jgi:hypothetical protein
VSAHKNKVGRDPVEPKLKSKALHEKSWGVFVCAGRIGPALSLLFFIKRQSVLSSASMSLRDADGFGSYTLNAIDFNFFDWRI